MKHMTRRAVDEVRPVGDAYVLQWGVQSGGYRLVEAVPLPPRAELWSWMGREPTPEAEWILAPVKSGSPPSSYEPLRDDPALFLKFLAIRTRDEVVTFASRFGELERVETNAPAIRRLHFDEESGTSIPTAARLQEIKKAEKADVFAGFPSGESVADWIKEADAMGEIWDMWTEIQTGNSETLDIEWVGDEVFHVTPGGRRLIADISLAPEIARRFPRGSRDKPALAVIQREVNRRITGRVTASLLRGDVTGRDGLMTHFVPDSLLSALWLQVATAVSGNKTYRACVFCGEFFEIGPGGNTGKRVDAEYCSGRCRTAASRDRTLKLGARRRKARRSARGRKEK